MKRELSSGTKQDLFAPVARIEAIRIFLAYASYMGFTVYQMDERIFKKKTKKKAKNKQIQARNGKDKEKDKVLSHLSEEYTT
ncbi:hypothetical protein Tco_0358508 [Tanacetum coccineum]